MLIRPIKNACNVMSKQCLRLPFLIHLGTDKAADTTQAVERSTRRLPTGSNAVKKGGLIPESYLLAGSKEGYNVAVPQAAQQADLLQKAVSLAR